VVAFQAAWHLDALMLQEVLLLEASQVKASLVAWLKAVDLVRG